MADLSGSMWASIQRHGRLQEAERREECYEINLSFTARMILFSFLFVCLFTLGGFQTQACYGDMGQL